ncbi:MAG: pyruvate kinase [Gammaproteobacteria bacterium]|nr:pyruvate kinase [Gammaproteobacteria bacterium]MCP5201441.1 pyruvate kinase [Gammaproteobacteria bacterium]
MPIVTEVDLLKYRRTKIVATVGPACGTPAMIRTLIETGVNVFRVNMSHGSHAGHGQAIDMIREVAAELGTATAILADLCGPKIRTGKFTAGAVELVAGSEVVITTADVPGDAGLIPSQYAALPRDVAVGHRVLLNDGAAELSVLAIEGDTVRCRVVAGGKVGDHKGINLPDSEVSAPSLTAKDRADAAFALDAGVDFLALSFVRSADDIRELRALTDAAPMAVGIIAKIEKPEALDNSEAIIAEADGIMVARGDLGVELNPEQVPLAQAQLVTRARAMNKPVIVATQMLESMITAARPTRAEVSDVSFAVASGADAVMLSGESAVGAFPVEAVRMMDRVARQTESYHWHTGLDFVSSRGAADGEIKPFGDAIADAAAQLVGDVRARAVIVISSQGMTAATISAARPAAPVVAISKDPRTCRRMNLMWGMIPHYVEAVGSENPNHIARRAARDLGLAADGEFVVMVRGFHADPALNSPSITLLQV